MDFRSQRGTTLIEAMIATSILLVASVGVLGVHRQQLHMNGEARHITEATALAQDLVENIALWEYTDTRLSDASTGNNTDIGDVAARFESSSTLSSSSYDHGEADLALATWNGLPARRGFERYWNVAYVDDTDANGIWDAARIAVIVRWPAGTGWRRIVVLTSKLNPAEAR